ncbi:uncharacterized protein LOC130444675 [Diorhabda sublineata]|uniref:uncharacterized protein LOC130444675 n=1 Tax=Diorhabda sublineata TaxID=1163346 RepID=UPI0024E0D290|nr:uncharacterized protein LOC130444675 [Diorhabda sublineata]
MDFADGKEVPASRNSVISRYPSKIGKPRQRITGMEPENSKNREKPYDRVLSIKRQDEEKIIELSKIITKQQAEYELLIKTMGQQIKSLEEKIKNSEERETGKNKLIGALKEYNHELKAENESFERKIEEMERNLTPEGRKKPERQSSEEEDISTDKQVQEELEKIRREEQRKQTKPERRLPPIILVPTNVDSTTQTASAKENRCPV